MTVNACRVCGQALFEHPLIEFRNMPKAAQMFPGREALPYEKGTDLTVCQCRGCGLVQLSSEPVPYFREVIRAAGVSAVLQADKSAQFLAFVERFQLQGKKIIEVGCGCGEFLSLLSALPVQACGLEYSAEAVQKCRNAGLLVERGYPDRESSPLSGSPFDAFMLLMFLEHMPDPNAALRNLRANLKEGAYGLVEVPNFDMVIRQRLFSEFTADHLLYFTEATLRSSLEWNGFEVLEVSQKRDSYVLSALVKTRTPHDLQAFKDHQQQILTQIDAYVGGFPDKKVAIWGAGHQALAILALMGTLDRIAYVVDSAPFKQGLFTPATHLPIFPPETLVSSPVDAVIVMAASYSDEVAGILRSRFNPDLAIAILRDFGLEHILLLNQP